MATEAITYNAVGLFAFDTKTEKYQLRASARLQDDGSVAFEGSPVLVERLKSQAVTVAGDSFLPADGGAYLAALIQRYTDPHLKAMPLKS